MGDFETILSFIKEIYKKSHYVCEAESHEKFTTFVYSFPISFQLEIKRWHQKIR